MDLSHFPLDFPLEEKKQLADGKVLYSYKKSQHVRLLLRNLAEMQAKAVQTDLIVQNKSKDLEEPFHSELLAACSPSMKQALAGMNYDLTGAISFGNITANQLKAFRDFLYKPEAILDEEIIADLEQFAKKYRIHSLARLCGQRKHQREGAEGMAVWAKHYEDLLAQLYEMFQKTEFTKAILKGDEESCETPVHGPLIGAASPVFRDMFCNEQFSQEGQKYHLKGLSSNTLNCLVRYIYTGEVTVDDATVHDLLQKSCTYKIPAIISACCDWLSSTMSAYNAIGIWRLARETESEDTNSLEREAKAFIVEKFCKVCEEDDEYYDLAYEDLKEIIQDDDRGVDCEEDVFKAVETWVEADKEVRSRYFCDLFKCVRLANTSVKFLRNLETHPLVQDFATCLQAVNRALPEIQEPTKTKVEEKATQNPQEKDVPLKEDATPDRRTVQRNTQGSSQGNTVKEKATSGMPENGIPRKEDGTPDMCSKVNETTSGSSPFSCTDRSSSGESIGPLKSDSSTDEKSAVNKAAYSSQRSSGSSGDSSGRSSHVLVGCSSLVTSACKSDNQPGTFTCQRTRCKTCPYISNKVNISGPNGSIEVIDHLTCISENVLYCITCTQCGKIYIGETGKRLADRFCQHQRSVVKNASTSVARHFNLPDHSHHNMNISGLSLHHGDKKSRRSRERDFILQLGTLRPQGINIQLPSSIHPDECTGRSSSGESIANMAVSSRPSSSDTSGYQAYSSGMSASGSSSGGSSCPGPRKKDGTPDMRYAVNKAAYRSQMFR